MIVAEKIVFSLKLFDSRTLLLKWRHLKIGMVDWVNISAISDWQSPLLVVYFANLMGCLLENS